MNAILIVAHGSRREESNEEVRVLTERVASHAECQFDLVGSAFLELAKPSIPDGIQQLIEKGAKSVLVVPYFLARGTHVTADIPAEVAKARSANPQIDIHVSEHPGASAIMPELLLELAQLPSAPVRYSE